MSFGTKVTKMHGAFECSIDTRRYLEATWAVSANFNKPVDLLRFPALSGELRRMQLLNQSLPNQQISRQKVAKDKSVTRNESLKLNFCNFDPSAKFLKDASDLSSK